MTWVNANSRTARAAGTISAILLATILVTAAGSNVLGAAYAEVTDKRNTTSQIMSSIMAQGETATIPTFSGQISSVQVDDDGNPSWI